MADDTTVALVTGGARRIGAAIARDLAAHGFAVAIHANGSRDEADVLAGEIVSAGGKAAVVIADLADPGAVGNLVAKAAEAFGQVGLLVNNASVFEADTLQDFEPDVWDRHFAVHLKAPAILARAMAAALPRDVPGLVVNVIDQRVWRLTPNFFSYTLSKAALWAATQTMAQALAPRIRVNAIGPGPTLANQNQDQADFDAQVAALLLERGPALDEFGATIRYLWQVRSVTGQMIALDGGQHLAWETPDVTGMKE